MATSKSSDEIYHSTIVSGDHGSQYQKNLFLTIFERLTMEKRDFRLAYEMTDAGKFDDVVVFLKNAANGGDEGWFFQAKHTDTSNGSKPPPITYEMLFPKGNSEQSKADFSLSKYIVSYSTVRRKFQDKSIFFIFTNRDMSPENIHKFSSNRIKVVPREVGKVLQFSGKNVSLEVDESMIIEIRDSINKEFYALRKAVLSFIKSGVVDSLIEKYKTPLGDVLQKSSEIISFKPTFTCESSKPELYQFYKALEEKQSGFTELQLFVTDENNIDNRITNIFIGFSKNRKLPPLVDKSTVKEFFNDLVLSINQPNDLRTIISDDLQVWMKTWLRPEYYGKLDTDGLQKPVCEFEALFDQINVGRNKKQYLQLAQGKKCLADIKALKIFEQEEFCPFYVNRQIGIIDKKKRDEDYGSDCCDEFSDKEFAEKLTAKFVDQRFFVLSAEPGMGKTTVLQYIAYEAQQIPGRYVYLIYLNKIQRALESTDSISDLKGALSTLNCVLSKAHLENIENSKEANVENKRIVLFFAAFDEVAGEDRDKVLDIFEQLLNVPNVQLVVGGRRHIEMLLENKFEGKVKVNSMRLTSFREEDKINFLKMFWKAPENSEVIFKKYATELVNLLYSTENRTLSEFTGLPFTLKMLAELSKTDFEMYLKSNGQYESSLLTQKIVGIVDLFEKFIELSFKAEMMKLYPNLKPKSKKYKIFFDSFILQHQLFAIEKLKIPFWRECMKIPKYKEEHEDFLDSIEEQDGKSPLVDVVNKDAQFVHLTYAEFFAAQFIYSHVDKILCSEFENAFCSKNFKVIQGFFFAILETKDDFKCLETLLKDVNGKIKQELAHEVLMDATQFYKVFKFLIDSFGADLDINYKRPSAKVTLIVANESMKPLGETDKNSVNLNGKALLHAATQFNQIYVMDLLLQQSAKINIMDEEGWTPLHYAVKFASVDAVKLLIENKADLKIANKLGQFPASIAIMRIKKCKSTIKYLEGKKKDSNEYYSAQLEEFNNKLKLIYEMMQLMIEKIDNVNASNKLGETLLHHAARKGDEKAVDLLLKRFANINAQDKEKQTPLLLAARYNHIGVLKLLLEKLANVDLADKNGWTPLHKAVKQSSIDAVKFLLGRKANLKMVDKSGQTPIHHAISQLKEFNNDLNLGLLKMLIESLDDLKSVNEHGKPLLHHAVKENVKEAVDILLHHLANINALDMNNQTPLHLAARFNYHEMLTLLVEKSALLNVTDKDGQTPLHIAVRYISVDSVQLLLKYGANLNITNSEGETPVHIAITRLRKCKMNIEYYTRKMEVPSEAAPSITNNQKNIYNKEKEKFYNQQNIFKELLKLMIDKLDDVNTVFQNGDTLLHHAAKEGVEDAVNQLLIRSANVNAQDVDGKTPLYLAILNKRPNVLKLLFDKSADVNLADKDGLTPLHIASREGFEECTKILLEQNANLDSQNVFGKTPVHLAIESIKECQLKIDECRKDSRTTPDKIINKLKSCVRTLEQLNPNVHHANVEVVEDTVNLLLKNSANENVPDVE